MSGAFSSDERTRPGGLFARMRQLLRGRRDVPVEALDRGLVAMCTKGGVFVSWRLLRDEDAVFGDARDNMVFQLLRDGHEIASLSATTSYLDPDGTGESSYCVVDGRGACSQTVKPFASGENYFDVPLVRPPATEYGEYTVGDTAVGDLDGDGRYELVVKWDCNPRDNAHDGFTGNVLLDAYRLDGTRLWANPINLGRNVRSGAHYTQLLVYDFDGDGRAELTCKTAPGSRDARGRFVSQASRIDLIRTVDDMADHRNPTGRILEGDEFLTVFSGPTGCALDTVYYPNQRVNAAVWGDSYGNRVDRFTAAVAYLDGRRPHAVYMRGYYMGRSGGDGQRQAACALVFDGRRLRCVASFDTLDVGLHAGDDTDSFFGDGTYKGVAGYARGNGRYVGQGNHNCAVADVDGDGRDEVLTGALCYQLRPFGRLGVKWCTFRGHGDALHLGAYDPTHEGFELFTVHEEQGVNKFSQTVCDGGMSVIDAVTGHVVFHVGAPGDTGRGMMANIGAGGYYQFWGAAGAFCQPEGGTVPRRALGDHGFEPVDLGPVSTNFRIFWDGDLLDELLDGTGDGNLEITSWNGSGMERVFATKGCHAINGTKQVPCLQADILGDWREELLVPRADNAAIRVYVSDVPTRHRMMTLMHDHVYRMGVAAQQTGYNQPPHIGFYLDESCFGLGDGG